VVDPTERGGKMEGPGGKVEKPGGKVEGPGFSPALFMARFLLFPTREVIP